jgi:AmmeMemoRadiSam system protein A
MSNNPFVRLAKETIRSYLTNGVIPQPPKDLAEEFLEKRGVFVSIKKHGQLRGCIGTVEPTKNNVAEELIHNAVSASTQDPRFPSITLDELEDLTISVDLLSPLEKVTDSSQLDPKKYGILVSSKSKKGVLLPNLEGVDTIEEQLRISKSKGGIAHQEKFEIQRFEVKRFYDQ